MSLTKQQVEQLLSQIESKASPFPSIRIERMKSPAVGLEIKISDLGGFDVGIEWDDQVSEWFVSAGFDGAHSHEEYRCDIVGLFELLLSDRCRLRTIRGKILTRSIVEIKDAQNWSRFFETRCFVWRLSKNKSEEIRQNKILINK